MKFIILLFIFVEIYGFNKNINISKLSGCRELRLDGTGNNLLSFPITSFINNHANDNEKLRMKFYVIGYDFYFYFKYSETQNHQFRACIEGMKRSTCKIQSYINEKKDLQVVNCENLTHDFYYTELTLIIAKNGVIQFYKKNENIPFLFADASFGFPLTHLSFDRYENETVDTRLFFDCPY
uniref:Farnesoic acid O-methyl transferase domain-containing protein n=1 Tax=Megaselia scalaris TaxID=36166 RepID=T1GUX8_MEGSC